MAGSEKIPGSGEDPGKILMDDLAVVCVHHIVEASSPVHPQSQRPVFLLVAEGELHLVPVSPGDRAGLDGIQGDVRLYLVQQGPHLLFLDGGLGLIRDGLHKAAAAVPKVGAGIRRGL